MPQYHPRSPRFARRAGAAGLEASGGGSGAPAARSTTLILRSGTGSLGNEGDIYGEATASPLYLPPPQMIIILLCGASNTLEDEGITQKIGPAVECTTYLHRHQFQ